MKEKEREKLSIIFMAGGGLSPNNDDLRVNLLFRFNFESTRTTWKEAQKNRKENDLISF